MLLGDVIARLDDPAVAAETLLSLDDLSLTARVTEAAASRQVPLGDYAAGAVRAFVAQAGDEDWLTLIGRMGRAEDPARVFLSHALAHGLA
jgi:hypothetical protein